MTGILIKNRVSEKYRFFYGILSYPGVSIIFEILKIFLIHSDQI
jgi:uncharacterized membrane protein